MSLDTVSLFDDMEQDDTQHRVASRRALALAHHIVESNLGRFLRGARTEEEFYERLGLIRDDFASIVSYAASQVGYDTPEHTASALQDHYRLAVEFEKTPAEEEKEKEEEEGVTARKASGRRWTPRVAGPLEGPAQQGIGQGGQPYPVPVGDEAMHTCPQCGSMNHRTDPATGQPQCLDCGYTGAPTSPHGAPEPDLGEFGDQLGGALGMGDRGGMGGYWGSKQSAPLGDMDQGWHPPNQNPYEHLLGPNPNAVPGENFYNMQGQPDADPMRNNQGYMRPGLPKGVSDPNEGYEQIPAEVSPNPSPGDQWAGVPPQIAPNLPPVEVPEEYPRRYQGAVPFANDLADARANQYPHQDVSGDRGGMMPQDVTPGEMRSYSPDKSMAGGICPECGNLTDPNAPQCPTCGYANQPNPYGASTPGVIGRTADDQNNTGLGGPEPKMDKSQGPGSKPDVPGKLKEIDLLESIQRKNDDKLEDIGDIEHKSLPTQSGDEPFATGGEDFGPHTDTFNNDGQADPVTRETQASTNPLVSLLAEPWPSDALVEEAFKRF